MPDALVIQLARSLNLPPDAARHTLNHLVSTLHQQLDETGQARVPGLGTFRRDDEGLTFAPDDALARAVNHRYAGLRSIEAGPHRRQAPIDDDLLDELADPFAAVSTEAEALTANEPAEAEDAEEEPAEAPVTFQPLDSFVDESDADEPDGLDADEAPETAAEPEPETPQTLEPFASGAFEEADEEAIEDPDEDEDVTKTFEPFVPGAFDEEDEEPDEGPVADEPIGAEATSEAAPPSEQDEGDYDLDDVLVGAWEDEPEAAPEPEPEEVADAEMDWSAALEEADAEEEIDDAMPAAEDDERLADDEPIAAPLADDSEATEEAFAPSPEEPFAEEAQDEVAADDEEEHAEPAETAPFAEALRQAEEEPDSVFATPPDDDFDEASEPEEPVAVAPPPPPVPLERPSDRAAEPGRGARRIAVPLIVAVLGIAALAWFLTREPSAPVVAEQPPADTSTVAALPPASDTVATPADGLAEVPDEPEPEPEPEDALRGGGDLDVSAGGFTWVVASEVSQAAAERRVARYREQGLRAGVVAEQAAGRTRYRVGLGQFASIAEANARRSDLPADVPSDSWILRL